MDTKELAELGILGILAEANEPLSIATIQDRLQENFDRYWEYGQGVLSPAVERLENNDNIQYVPVTSSYEITYDGKDRLTTLLRQSIDVEDATTITRRHHLVIQFGFLHHLPESEQVQVLNTLENKFQEEYDRWHTIADKEQTSSLNESQGYRQDLIDLNIRILSEHIDWIQNLTPYQ